jgi:hypothetical protein
MSRFLTLVPALAFAASWTFAAVAQAPEPVVPGSPHLDATRISARTDTFVSVRYRNGAEVERSTVERTIARSPASSGDEIVFTQRYATPRGATTDVTWLDAATLAPHRYEAEVYGETQTLRFEPTRVTGTVDAKGASRPIDEPLDGPVFSAVAVDLLYEAIAWRPGFSVSLPAFNPPSLRLSITLAVVGEERIRLTSGRDVAAWKLSFYPGRGSASDVWIDRETGRFLMLRLGTATDGFVKARADVVTGGVSAP